MGWRYQESRAQSLNFLDNCSDVRQLFLVFRAWPSLPSNNLVEFLVRTLLHIRMRCNESNGPQNETGGLQWEQISGLVLPYRPLNRELTECTPPIVNAAMSIQMSSQSNPSFSCSSNKVFAKQSSTFCFESNRSFTRRTIGLYALMSASCTLRARVWVLVGSHCNSLIKSTEFENAPDGRWSETPCTAKYYCRPGPYP